MNRVAKFEKVSFKQFRDDWIKNCFENSEDINIETTELDQIIYEVYKNIQLPKRSTKGSAGYDFFAPSVFEIPINGSVKIPTGIRCKIDEGWVLKEYPRSGQGFKYGLHLANSVGIIDSDYYNSDNEGHIFVKLVNDSALAKPITLEAGQAFCQGIFIPFGITVDDNANGIRNGGFGSTDKISTTT